jgi:hypothetical protein
VQYRFNRRYDLRTRSLRARCALHRLPW